MFTKSIKLLSIFSVIVMAWSCQGQTNEAKSQPTVASSHKIVGGPFENGEYMFIDMPKNIKVSDTSPGWNQSGQKLLITGTIFKMDGKTPAPNIIMYYYQTDVNGYYSSSDNKMSKAARHGDIRGWVKTDENGKYSIYTVRPAAYPNSAEPAHIHPSIKEPDINNPYYIDEFVFDDDPILTTAKRKNMRNRGGSGVLRLLEQGDLQIAEHNIILGLNIPDYPEKYNATESSGRAVGEDIMSFTPFHAYGPDKGSKTCPICKYGRYHGILYFVGDNPNWDNISIWLKFLESESKARKKYLKAYFVYGNDKNYNEALVRQQLEELGQALNIEYTALTFVPSFSDTASDIDLNRINPDVGNTFLIFKHSNIVAKYINLKPTPENFERLSETLDATQGDYFQLSSPKQKN